MNTQETTLLINEYKKQIISSMEYPREKEFNENLLNSLIDRIPEYTDAEFFYKNFVRKEGFYRNYDLSELPESEKLHDILRSHYENVLKPLQMAEQAEKRRHDYTVNLRAKYKLWVAEILAKGEGAYEFDRRFLDKEERSYLSEYGDSVKQVEFFCKNGIIYQSFYSTGRMTGEYRFHFNNTEYETYKLALAAKLAAEAPAVITHGQFMRLAWLRAKELAGGSSKGSKKFLSQAMKELNQQFSH